MRKVERIKMGLDRPEQHITFPELAKRFIEYQRPRLTQRSCERQEGIVNNYLIPFFSDRQVSEVKRIDIQKYVTERSLKASAETTIKELNTLKHLFRLAVEWEIIRDNPANGVKGPKAPPGRTRYLQPGELKLIVDQSPHWLRPIILLAVSTCMRRSEILGIRWIDVDLNNNLIWLRKTKNNDGRIIHLNRIAQTVLISISVDHPTLPTDRIFNADPDYIGQSFRKVCKDAKIVDFKFHDLRHCFASWARMSGADIHTIAVLMGHRDLRMAQRYQHLSGEFLSDAVGRLDNVFGNLIEDGCQGVATPETPVPGVALTHRK